ncbi:MAG: hypothetical protein IKR40_09285 [Treponema sp.]|jgi:hypothetical protein|nr:hypothetical protein [Treponema sp.]
MSVVVWKVPENMWMADNQEGEQHLFGSEAAAIQSAVDMEKNKPNPEYVLVYKKDGKGFKSKIPV